MFAHEKDNYYFAVNVSFVGNLNLKDAKICRIVRDANVKVEGESLRINYLRSGKWNCLAKKNYDSSLNCELQTYVASVGTWECKRNPQNTDECRNIQKYVK